jgi:hypothetical protein
MKLLLVRVAAIGVVVDDCASARHNGVTTTLNKTLSCTVSQRKEITTWLVLNKLHENPLEEKPLVR